MSHGNTLRAHTHCAACQAAVMLSFLGMRGDEMKITAVFFAPGSLGDKNESSPVQRESTRRAKAVGNCSNTSKNRKNMVKTIWWKACGETNILQDSK